MADCSITEVFVEEYKRMCKYFAKCCDCPCSRHNNDTGLHCSEFVNSYPKIAVSLLQKWSDDHKLPKYKTYADDFFEKHPDARYFMKDGSKIPSVSRCYIYGMSVCPNYSIHGCCYDDKVRCWLEPYIEKEVD